MEKESQADIKAVLDKVTMEVRQYALPEPLLIKTLNVISTSVTTLSYVEMKQLIDALRGLKLVTIFEAPKEIEPNGKAKS